MQKGYIFGHYLGFENTPTEEEMEAAKETVVEVLCDAIRRLSRTYPEEFFIIKDTSNFPVGSMVCTVGAKLIAPTIEEKE